MTASIAALVIVLGAICLLLALSAGYGIGSAQTYARLRPERIAKEMQVETMNVLHGMREVHDSALRSMVEQSPARVLDEDASMPGKPAKVEAPQVPRGPRPGPPPLAPIPPVPAPRRRDPRLDLPAPRRRNSRLDGGRPPMRGATS